MEIINNVFQVHIFLLNIKCELSRTAVLALSVIFHHKAEQYVENVNNWKQAADSGNVPSDIVMLENAIHQHQNLYESMCQAYTEVRS